MRFVTVGVAAGSIPEKSYYLVTPLVRFFLLSIEPSPKYRPKSLEGLGEAPGGGLRAGVS